MMLSDNAPTRDALLDARRVELTREAGSEPARRLCAAVASLSEPHLGQQRVIGRAGRSRLQGDIGTILADLLRQSFRDHLSAAARGHASPMWESSIMGRKRFWGRVDAMAGAGLVGVRAGLRVLASVQWEEGGDTDYSGAPAVLWPTGALLEMAATKGVTAETVGVDWRISPAAETRAPAIAVDDLVRCVVAATVPVARGGARSARPRKRMIPAILTPAQTEEKDAIRARVAALNARVAAVDIRGCRAPAFRRNFRPSLQLGGRLYSVGTGHYQAMSKADRADITINGEPVVEIDIHAAHLSIFLALTGTTKLPKGDLYTRVGLPRDVVKAWCVQTFGAGKHLSQWARNTADVVRATPIVVVKEAVLSTYPALRSLGTVVPASVLADLPEGAGPVAGQYLVYRESGIIEGAMDYLVAHGVVGLPVHDSIIVAKGAEWLAREGLDGASLTSLGVALRLGAAEGP